MNQAINAKPDVSVAPMMDWTDRHCRFFLRLISPNTRLYTEMLTTGALLHGDRERFLAYSAEEKPLALQLGGSDPVAMAECAKMAEDAGYSEVNINCGCPSDRVQSGRFGACLMKEPALVADCVAAMTRAVKIPVTVKSRIGIDDLDSFEFLNAFVGKIADSGCKTFILHARKAWLNGLSPKENREVPPINYDRVAAVKNKYPHLRIIVNGNIRTSEEVARHLEVFDGVMIGREAYQNPYALAKIETHIFSAAHTPTREEIALAMIPYARRQKEAYGTPVKSITRHIINLYQGCPGARSWRQVLSTLPYEDGATENVIARALQAQKDAVASMRRVA
jgi:tRNA-dihydrouridine synthase A